MQLEPLPKRTEYTRWSNYEPITDIPIALRLLKMESPFYEQFAHVRRCPRTATWDWEIIIPWYQGDRGGDMSGFHYYQIDPALAEQLVKEGWVEPSKKISEGYVQEFPDELVLSEDGKKKVEAFEHAMRKKAESLLKPGVHTDLTGKPRSVSMSTPLDAKPIHFTFSMPDNSFCTVCPEEERIEMPD